MVIAGIPRFAEFAVTDGDPVGEPVHFENDFPAHRHAWFGGISLHQGPAVHVQSMVTRANQRESAGDENQNQGYRND
jgi:hypothetical protein